MKKYLKLISLFSAFIIASCEITSVIVYADVLNESISSKSAILLEAETGTVIYEKNADEKLYPASITKIMTLILVFDAIKSGKICLDDTITTSEYAASMGGSQVFLEPGETQSVDTMIKCIAVASANDACVAMAEAISGTEETFVENMNERAKELGMTNTNFVNCNGLDSDNHYSTARDVAIMSRELITQYPEIYKYSSIWMENIVHKTSKGENEFGLTNTNKLIKQYEYATGLKTGSTSLAKYCVSATARKDDIDLIAVVMCAPDYKIRFSDATKLLNYGFGVCRMYRDEDMPILEDVSIDMGVSDTCSLVYENTFSYMDMNNIDFSDIKKELVLNDVHVAPIQAGQIAGNLIYTIDGNEIGKVAVLYSDSIGRANFLDCIKKSIFAYIS